MYIIIAVILIVLGVVILQESEKVIEMRERYDDADDCSVGKQCKLKFDIDDDMDEPIYLYYELTNYYQNHRLYVRSRSEEQLQGYDINSE